MQRNARSAFAMVGFVLCSAAIARADDAGVSVDAEGPKLTTVVFDNEPVVADTPRLMLEVDLGLLNRKKMIAVPATSVDELSSVLEDAHRRALAGRKDEAAMLLLEAVEGPRFRAFESFSEFAAADLMLASLLIEQRALLSAQRCVDRLLARGADTPTFGPAFRRGVDIALARAELVGAADALRERAPKALPRDAENELHYLAALPAFDARDDGTARRELAAITGESRFYGRAQYLLGVIAARARSYDEATTRFCAVRRIMQGAPRTRYESGALYATDDLATLGMGRVAHEQGHSKQAFEHYFQIPNDSPLLVQALFESAYASYEQGHPRTALDSLAQLEARYPDSPYTAEARVLRGYVHLDSCDFERAERELIAFEGTFGELVRELGETLESPASTHRLYAADEGAPAARREQLLSKLLMRDPAVERVRAQLASLDAELARTSRTGDAFAALAARVRGSDAPRARFDEAATPNDTQRIAALRARTSVLQSAIEALSSDLVSMREAGAERGEIAALQKTVRTLVKQSDAVEARLRSLARKDERRNDRPVGAEIGARLDEERDYVEATRARALDLRERLEDELARRERIAVEQLKGRLEKELRRAHIGRIDAVMGKKRKLELEVESLSAGRFPPELSLSKQTPVLLRDDQEYWPFEGEDWPDEFVEQP